MFYFSTFRITDPPTDQRTDRPSYKDTRTHLKSYFVFNVGKWLEAKIMSPNFYQFAWYSIENLITNVHRVFTDYKFYWFSSWPDRLTERRTIGRTEKWTEGPFSNRCAGRT